jgi:hypothetical protein
MKLSHGSIGILLVVLQRAMPFQIGGKCGEWNYAQSHTFESTTVLFLLNADHFDFLSGCRADIKTGFTALESPGRSSHEKYPHNVKCTYTVSHPNGKQLSVSFDDDFRTEAEYDIVEVRLSHLKSVSSNQGASFIVGIIFIRVCHAIIFLLLSVQQ